MVHKTLPFHVIHGKLTKRDNSRRIELLQQNIECKLVESCLWQLTFCSIKEKSQSMSNNKYGSQNTSHWTNDWETRTGLRTGEKGNELRYSMINSFCSVSGTCRVTAKPYKHFLSSSFFQCQKSPRAVYTQNALLIWNFRLTHFIEKVVQVLI
jgi:hypothetical protein